MSTFVGVWPILDQELTRTELIAEATPDLLRLADEADAVITGPAQWTVQPDGQVEDWIGPVLIARCPAEHHPVVAWLPRRDVDEVAIERALSGTPVELGEAEQIEAIRRGTRRRMSDKQIGDLTGLSARTVLRLRQEHGIETGLPGCRRSA